MMMTMTMTKNIGYGNRLLLSGIGIILGMG